MEDLDFAFIGQRIRELRNEKMLTQEYVANAVDVNVSHISNIETNKVILNALSPHLQCAGHYDRLCVGTRIPLPRFYYGTGAY